MITTCQFTRILAVALLGLATTASASQSQQYQIKKFRFNRHNELNFERLVLEFAAKGQHRASPGIRLAPSASSKETVVYIDGATLVGAIPESTINDSYQKKSNYFGPISINTDTPSSGFTVRTFVKSNQAAVDAFWMENPSRLIVDVYPKDSPRAQGPEVLKNLHPRALASKTHHSHEEHAASPLPFDTGLDRVMCFMATAQVLANLDFEPGSKLRGISMTVDDSKANYNTGDKSVVCYPYKALVQARVSFSPKNQIPNASIELNQTMTPAQPAPQPIAPPVTTAPPPVSKEEQLNKDADLALGETDEGRGLSSPSFFSGADNFNKDNPPPSLGKALAPPGGNAAPILANPAPINLLPPVK